MIDARDDDQLNDNAWFESLEAEIFFPADRTGERSTKKRTSLSKLHIIDQILADKKLEKYLASYSFENYFETTDGYQPS